MQFSLFELHGKGKLCPDIIVHNLTRKPIRHVPAFSAQIILIEFTCVCWSPSKLNTLDLLISFSFFLFYVCNICYLYAGWWIQAEKIGPCHGRWKPKLLRYYKYLLEQYDFKQTINDRGHKFLLVKRVCKIIISF